MEYLVKTLVRAGLEARVVSDGQFELSQERIVWISGNPTWHPKAMRKLLRARVDERPLIVYWHVEPLPFARVDQRSLEPLHLRELAKIVLRDDRVTDPHSNARCLRRYAAAGLIDVLVVSTRSSQAYLSELGIVAEHVPLGYRPDHGEDLELERDIDALFIGDTRVPRRRRIFRRLAREGVSVRAVGGWGEMGCWGEERTRLLNRAKILLNVPRHSGHLSGGQMILGMVNKALVVADPIVRPEPYLEGQHFVAASVEEMPTVIERWLSDEVGRNRIVEAAHRFVTTELTFERSIARLLTAIEERVKLGK
jgi:glycosyltransferase involved in cell wall biosynthesis